MNHKNITYFILIVVCALLSYVTQQALYASPNVPEQENVASIQGYVWLDKNEDGQKNADEAGEDNIMIRLYDMGNLLKGDTLTDSDGLFRFDELANSDYRLEIIQPIGYEFTVSDQGDDASDSDVNLATGEITSRAEENVTEQSTVGVGFIERPLDPTPIELTEFEAGIDPGGEGIAVQWTTGAEVETRGFRIWRSTTVYRADAVEITGGLIPSQDPDSNNNRRYLYIDKNIVDFNILYTYWLQEVENNNTTHDYGPKYMSGVIAVDETIQPLVPIPDSDLDTRVYLPLVRR